MPYPDVLTADNFIGKAETIEGVLRWVKSIFGDARTNSHAYILLKVLIILLWVILRPFRQHGTSAVEPANLRGAATRFARISDGLSEAISSAVRARAHTHPLFRGSFRTLSLYQKEIEALERMLLQKSDEWDEIVVDYGTDMLRKAIGSLATQAPHSTEYPVNAFSETEVASSLDPDVLRDHVGHALSA